MARIFKIDPDNKLVVLLAGIGLFIALLLYVTYPPLREASSIYGAIAIVGLFFYTNPIFQDYLIGIPKKGLLKLLLIGGAIGIGFVVLPKFIPGLSMGVPIVPASVDSNLKWVVICLFAPVLEEIATRGALLGFIKYITSKRGVSTFELWIAIVAQAIFFVLLHALAYASGWYNAPAWTGQLGVFSQLGAVSASLIAAGIFGLIMGFIVTRKKINSLSVAILSHYIVNQLLFVGLVVALG